MQKQLQQLPPSQMAKEILIGPTYPIKSSPLLQSKPSTLQQCRIMLQQVDILEGKIRMLEKRYSRGLKRKTHNSRRLRRKRQEMRFNYRCPERECGKVYASPTSLKLHMRHKHGRVISRDEIVRIQINPQ